MKLKTPKAAPTQAQSAPPADGEGPQTLPFPSQDQQQQSPADEAAKMLEAKPASEPAGQPAGEQPALPLQEPSGVKWADANWDASEVVGFGDHANGHRLHETRKIGDRFFTRLYNSDGSFVRQYEDTTWGKELPAPAPVEPIDHIAMYEQALADATQRHLEAALAREALQGELKEAKDEEKAALKLVSKIKSRGPEAYRQAMQPLPTPITENTAGGDAGSLDPQPSGSIGSTPPAANTDESWKLAKLEELSLKPALHEKLIENGIATLGDLENLRMQIADNKKDWPKGIGEAKITAIENAVVDWLSKNRDRQVVAEATAVPATAVESQEVKKCNTISPSPIEPAEPDSSPLKYPSQQSWDAWTEHQQTKWIEARAKELEVVISPPEEGELPAWQKGFDDFCEGDTLENCELPPGQDMDLWIRGWQAAWAKDEDAGGENESHAFAASMGAATSLDDLLT